MLKLKIGGTYANKLGEVFTITKKINGSFDFEAECGTQFKENGQYLWDLSSDHDLIIELKIEEKPMNDLKIARIKINSEEERQILKGFFELQGWKCSNMADWRGNFPFYGYNSCANEVISHDLGATGVFYNSLNDFFLKKPIVKYKEFKLNKDYTAHIYPDKVMVGEVEVSFATIREIVSDKPSDILNNCVVRVPTQELFDIVNKLGENPIDNENWRTYKDQTYIRFENEYSYFGSLSGGVFYDFPEVQIADLFITKPREVKINEEYTALITGDEARIGCQNFKLSLIKQLADLL